MSAPREKLLLIDGSSYFFRAFYAIQRLSRSDGFPTNAIYGFIQMLLRALEAEKPKHLAICFDTAKPSFRKTLYTEYKANREAPPEDLVVQIPIIQQAVDCFKIARLEMAGFEADDVIGTVAEQAVRAGYDVEIITGDKDLMQLVNENVTLYDTMKERRVNIDGVIQRFNVKPEQIVDLLALMGDASDNIPGVKGVGEKTAAELINQFGTLEKLYESLDQVKQPKRREILTRDKGQAFMSQELATVCRTVPIQYTWKDLEYHGPDLKALQAFFELYEFQGLLKRFEMKVEEKAYTAGKYAAIVKESELDALIPKLKAAELIGIDTETTSLTIHDANLVGISFSVKQGEAFYIPVGHHITSEPNELLAGQLPMDLVRSKLKPILEDPKYAKVGQHLKYDAQILKRWGVELNGIVSDTLVASYLYDPSIPHSLDALAFRFLGHQNITYEELTGKGQAQIPFSEVEIGKATEYAAEDADVTLRLHHQLMPELKKANLLELYHGVEVPLIPILAEMEYVGVGVDRDKLAAMGVELAVELKAAQEKIYELAGERFNVGSPKQLGKILFEKLGLPVVRKTKTGVSTDESVLEELSSSHEICQFILNYRSLAKLKSTYVEGMLAEIHPSTGRIHTHYNQTVTATGRLSSSNPNLQNIPTGEGKYDIRSVFIPQKGYRFFSADYSQIELRLLAAMSEDPELLRAFHHNEDVHAFTARLIFGDAAVTPEQRAIAKTINFGVIYGQTPFGLSQTLKIAPREAKEFIDTYFKRYPKIGSFLESLVLKAKDKGYAETILGRRRYFPELNSQNRLQREMAERAALNTPLQGSAADLIKKAMVDIDLEFRKLKLQSRMIMQVHDELIIETLTNEADQVEAVVKEKMENAFQLSVPLKVDTGWGDDWSQC